MENDNIKQLNYSLISKQHWMKNSLKKVSVKYYSFMQAIESSLFMIKLIQQKTMSSLGENFEVSIILSAHFSHSTGAPEMRVKEKFSSHLREWNYQTLQLLLTQETSLPQHRSSLFTIQAINFACYFKGIRLFVFSEK